MVNLIGQNSVKLHKKYKGKIGTELKVPINNKSDLSLAYTPGVATVSEIVAKFPQKTNELTLKGNTIAVVSDGSAVLGLGNIGPFGALPVMEGKAALFKRFGNVDAFPICLDTQNDDEIIKTVRLIAPNFGGINLEDIAAPRCFEIERKLQKMLDIPVMHDDQHGTALVVLAALINSLKVVNKSYDKVKVVINGAGAAGISIANLLIKFGVKDITVCDTKGIIGKHRKDLNLEKKKLANVTNKEKEIGILKEALVNADVFIGVSKGNLLNSGDITKMNKNAIVFAMANPIPEIMPSEALKGGAKVVATGRSDFGNQINNVLAFPGIFRGALDNKVKKLTDDMFINGAKNLAALIKHPSKENILPTAFDKRVVPTIAKAII